MTARPNDFTGTTRQQLADRVGYLCAYPGCNLLTIAAAKGQPGAIKLGVASHIVGAGPKGPRPASDHGYTDEQIRCADNGIWLCAHHALIVDRDPHFHHHNVATLQQWQRDAEDRASLDAHYGRTQAVTVSPDVVSRQAQAFVRRLRDVLPNMFLRFNRDIRMDLVRRIQDFLRDVHPFNPNHPLHGIEPDLVRAQLQIIDDLRAFVDFVTNTEYFWRDSDRGIYVANDRREPCQTVDYGDALIKRLGDMTQVISERWGQGQAYYRSR